MSVIDLEKPCDPPYACATHGRCWTHSEWDWDTVLPDGWAWDTMSMTCTGIEVRRWCARHVDSAGFVSPMGDAFFGRGGSDGLAAEALDVVRWVQERNERDPPPRPFVKLTLPEIERLKAAVVEFGDQLIALAPSDLEAERWHQCCIALIEAIVAAGGPGDGRWLVTQAIKRSVTPSPPALDTVTHDLAVALAQDLFRGGSRP